MFAVVARQQVVDADDRVAAIEQRFCEMRADEAGGAGDDDSSWHMATVRLSFQNAQFEFRLSNSSVSES